MKKWFVFNSKMTCIGTVVATDWTDAWDKANSKYRNVDYVRSV